MESEISSHTVCRNNKIVSTHLAADSYRLFCIPSLPLELPPLTAYMLAATCMCALTWINVRLTEIWGKNISLLEVGAGRG